MIYHFRTILYIKRVVNVLKSQYVLILNQIFDQNCYNNSAVDYVMMNKVIENINWLLSENIYNVRCQARRHTRFVFRLFSQWYGLVHNKNDIFFEKRCICKNNVDVTESRLEWLMC